VVSLSVLPASGSQRRSSFGGGSFVTESLSSVESVSGAERMLRHKAHQRACALMLGWLHVPLAW
jgi:hypothetical protein